jgi:5'(3')-deoxyribonucleotidase
MRLGIDLDGVVADFTGGWIRRYNAEFGTAIRTEDAVRWRAALDLTHFASMREFWHWARRGDGPSLFREFDTHEGAQAWLHELAGEHEVVIITTKPSWAVHDTYAWIAEKRLPTREVHITAQKWRVACDVYVDDNPYQLRDLVSNRREATVCRFVRPWNAPVAGTVDVAGWDEFGALVHDLSRR